MTDPHAGGRLDGGLLSSGVLDHPGAPRPLDLAELQRQYAPVLPLGFLTAARRRTLGQAAVAFVLTLGAVPAIRFRDARQLAELTDPPATEPLSDAELSRLERIAEIPPGAGAPRATPEFK
jgi:aryl-alcohol dehydrogenase-like predicted oxidoreductase